MPDFLREYFESLTKSFLSTLNTPHDYLNKIALTAIVIVIGMVLYFVLKSGITRNVKDIQRKFITIKLVKSTITTLVALVTLLIWIQAMNALVLIALSIGFLIFIMVRGLINNIIGYFVIKYNKYFKVGHRIEINGMLGDVIDTKLIHFRILEARNWLSSDSHTGRIIKLPNNIIFNESIEIVGISNTYIWHEIQYVLTFDSHWQDAEKIMTEVGNIYFEEYVAPHITENQEYLPNDLKDLQPVFSLRTNDDGIVLALRYLVHYKKGTSTKTFLHKKILTAFNAHPHINFAVLDIRILSKE